MRLAVGVQDGGAGFAHADSASFMAAKPHRLGLVRNIFPMQPPESLAPSGPCLSTAPGHYPEPEVDNGMGMP
jgi:hypothetical protein